MPNIPNLPPLPRCLGPRRVLRELLDLQHTQLFRLIESFAGLFDPTHKPLTFARDRSTSARKPGAVARKPKTAKCKAQSIEPRRCRASHARVRPLRASLKPPPQHPHPGAQGANPRRGKDARLARQGSRFARKAEGFARKGFGVARKAEGACAWRFERCTWCCVRTPTGGNGSERGFPDPAVRTGSLVGGVPGATGGGYITVYRCARDAPVKLGVESARGPGRTWK